MPTLPVIPIILAEEFFRIILAKLFNEEKVFFTFIKLFFGIFFIFLLTTTLQASFDIASFTKLCPSVFFPLIAKNKLFFFIVLVLIETPLYFIFLILLLLSAFFNIKSWWQ